LRLISNLQKLSKNRLKINYAGAEVTSGPIEFGATSLAATTIPFIMNMDIKAFGEVLKSRSSEMDMGDLTMLMMMAQTTAQKAWLGVMAANASAGQEAAVKVEFFLTKDKKSTTPAGSVIANGSFKCKVTAAGLDKLYKSGRIPESYKPAADDGVANDFHKKNVNKIAFDTKAISKTATSAGSSTCSSLKGGLYARVYLPKSLKNYGVAVGKPDQCNMTVRFFNGSKEIKEFGVYDITADQCKKATSYSIALAPNASDSKNHKTVSEFASMIKSMKEGSHTLKMEVVFEYLADGEGYKSISMAASDLKLNLDKSAKAAWEKIYAPDIKYVAGSGSTTSSNSSKSSSNSSELGFSTFSYTLRNKSSSTIKYESQVGQSAYSKSSLSAGNSTSLSGVENGSLKINGKHYATIKKSVREIIYK